MKRIIVMAVLIGIFIAMSPAVSAKATVVREGAIWNDGELFGTVLTPTELPDNAPDHSFDKLYNFDGSGLTGQRSVADAAPEDSDFNGGRWMVFPVTFTDLGISIHDPDGDGVVNFELTSEEQVLMHQSLGHILISEEPARLFVCPMIKLNKK